MDELRYTLLTDGTSDKTLLPLLTWLLRQHGVRIAIQAEWADLGRLRSVPKHLSEKIALAIELYPCDVLFIHRDAESATYQERFEEIIQALEELNDWDAITPICVIPIRMQEAWFLFDETALRQAAGNPHGRTRLQLPALKNVETLADPKMTLYALLKEASELKGRRLKDFNARQAVHRLSDEINDFSPLRQLSAFQYLEEDIQKAIHANQWR